MHCSSCRGVLPNGVDICPKCTTQASKEIMISDSKSGFVTERTTKSNAAGPASSVGAPPPNTPSTKRPSTLIEFPGSGKVRPKSQWRQELSERVRAIQERKAREAAENGEISYASEQTPDGPQLGLVSSREPADVNPIVAAALKRIERARESASPVPRGGRHASGATAVARARQEDFELDYVSETVPSTVENQLHVAEVVESVVEVPLKERKLVVVPPPPPATQASEVATSKTPRKVIEGVIDDDYLTRLEETLLPPVATVDPLDNYGAIPSRIMAGLLDLLIVAFFTLPFAAIVELTGSNWVDLRVTVTVGGIAALVLFLYHTSAITLSGKTFGMSALGLKVVNASTGYHPSTFQAMFRAFCFILVIATGFIGLIPSLFGGQRRGIHDMLSRTVVVSS